MGLADIATLVLQRVVDDIASPVGELRQSIEDSPVAEPGPPTGVQPFTESNATEAALAAKLGARLFQRARERRVEAAKANKRAADEAYRNAQLSRLQEATKIQREQLDETIRYHDLQTKPKPVDPKDELLDTDPETGKPLATKMTRDQWLRMRGQNKVSERAAAARTLQATLTRERLGAGARSSKTLEANRVLSQLPGMADLSKVAWAEALQAADAKRAAAGKPFKLADKNPTVAAREAQARTLLAQSLFPDIMLRHASTRDSLATAPMRTLRVAAGVDSAAAAQPIDLPPDFIDMLNEPD